MYYLLEKEMICLFLSRRISDNMALVFITYFYFINDVFNIFGE